MTGATPLSTPNGSLITSHTFAQLCHKVPTCYYGMSICTPKFPLPMGNYQSQLPASSLADLRYYPKQHPDPVSYFATIYWTDTHRPTDGIGDKTCTNTSLWLIWLKKALSKHTHPFYSPLDFVRDYLGQPVPEPIWILLKRQWVAVASAGPYANLSSVTSECRWWNFSD